MASRRARRQGRSSPDMMQQMQQLQARLFQAQQQMEQTTVEASAGGGAVTVSLSAHPKLLSVTIQPEVVDPDDVEMLEDLITAAMNEALENIRNIQIQQLGSLAAGLAIPGLTT